MNSPLVTIITACYNAEDTIDRTIRSLIAQSYENIQYIIIDGGSTDNTQNIIKSYSEYIDVFVSEKDDGIADAWNKGLSYAKGAVIGFLNADDVYEKSTLESMVVSFLKQPLNIIYGNCYFTDDGQVVSMNKKLFNRDKVHLGFGFVSTTCFIPSVVFKDVGHFDSSYKIAIDTDFLLRCINQKVEFVKSEHVVYMSLGGVSDTYAKKAFFEFNDSLLNNGLISSNTMRKQRRLYSLYYPLRKIIKSKSFLSLIRIIKHKLVGLCNLLFNLIPTMTLKNIYLKSMGVKLGKDSYILKKTKFYVNGNLTIGNNSIINRECLLDNRATISIGDNVSIAHNVKIYTGGHVVQSSYFEYFQKEVTIENEVCIFSNVIIQPGVTIARGSVVLPGSVVVSNVDSYCVYGGNPAKKISKRNDQLYYKFDYPFWDAL
jgi:glycosyltransferase involved in cell wall biosynthesis